MQNAPTQAARKGPLTDTQCRSAKTAPGERRARFTDGRGLYLEVTPNGAKRWFWKFRDNNRQQTLALGHYNRPGSTAVEMTLKEARAACEAARATKVKGVNPVAARKARSAVAPLISSADTFEAVYREFYALKVGSWSESHATQFLRCAEKDLFPYLGHLPIREVTAPQLLAALRLVEARGASQMVHDLRGFTSQVLRYGIATGKCDQDVASFLKGTLKPHTVKNMAAVLEPAKVGALMRAISAYNGQPTTRAALRLAALIFQRPVNIRAMEWAWVDLDGAMITIPAAAMKGTQAAKLNGRPHKVPLARQAIEVLQIVKPLTGTDRYVFASHRKGRPMSDGTLNAALKTLGYDGLMVSHGFRAMARTVLSEGVHGVDVEVIEAQLAHGKSGPLGTAYDRAEYMVKRQQLMQTWADHLDMLEASGA